MKHRPSRKVFFSWLAILLASSIIVFGCSPSGEGLNANGPSGKFGDGTVLLDPGQGNDIIGGGNATDPTNGTITGTFGGDGGAGQASDSSNTGTPTNTIPGPR